MTRRNPRMTRSEPNNPQVGVNPTQFCSRCKNIQLLKNNAEVVVYELELVWLALFAISMS